MIIEKLKLVNFCQFKNFSIDLTEAIRQNNGSIIGVIGSNGRGKSNLFKAIKYALTGQLSDASESYVRRADDGEEITKGSVELHFSFKGKQGRIFREIKLKGSGDRSLLWEGIEYNKAKDIELIMEQLVSADKHVLANAVFVTQGEIQNILSDSNAEREETFMRIFNLQFVDRNSKILSEILKKYRKEWDVESQTDQYRYLKEEEAKAQEELKFLIMQAPKQKPEELASKVQSFTQVCNLMEENSEIVSKVSRLKNYECMLRTEIKGLDTLIQEGTKGKDLASVEVKFQALQDKLKQLEKLKAANREYTSYAERLKELFQVTSSTDSIEELTVRRNINTALGQYYTCRSELQQEEKKKKGFELALANLRNILKKCEEDLATTKQELANESVSLQNNEAMAKAIRNIDRTATERFHCLTCGLKLADDAVKELIEQIPQMEDNLRKQKERIQKLRDVVAEQSYQRDNFASEVTRNESNLERSNVRIELTSTKLKEIEAMTLAINPTIVFDKEDLSESTKQEVARLDKAIGMVETANKEILQIQNKMQFLLTTYKNELQSPSTNIEYNQTLDEIENLKSVINLASNIKKLMSDRDAKLQNVNNIAAEKQMWSEKFDANETKLKALQSDAAEDMLFYKNEILKSQTELQECYTHDGKIAQARAAIQRLEVAKKSLEEALARNEKIIAFDAGLRLVEDILSRSGAPIEFIKLQFANLGTLTEKYLSILEAGFTIKANPQASLDFLFMRTDQTDSTWMPIGKLSGGQRVRLCLAFLLALQKLLVINIGLLFLDEPSNHLDDDGRSNLIQLFHSFQNNLLETQGQLWISDHDKNLATAFNVTIDLDHAS